MRVLITHLSKDFYFYIFCFIAFTIPFPIIINNIAIGILVLYWLFEGEFKKKLNTLKKRYIFQLFILLYIIHVAGLLHTENIEVGLFSLQKKVPLIIFPIVIGSLEKNSLTKPQVYVVLLCFTISCALVSLINVFNEQYFQIHPSYLGIYLIFSAGFLLTTSFSLKARYYTLFFILMSLMTSILLSARMALIIMFLEINVLLVVHFLIIKRFSPLLLLILLNIIGVVGILNYSPSKEKFNKLIEFHGDFIRERNWKSNMEVISNNLIFGVGIGDGTTELQKARDPLWHEAVFKYNSHNQYLQILVELGLVGLFVFFLCIIWPSFISIRNKNFLYLIFIISFFVPSLTESTLGLQKGTVFYGFFNSFLFFYGTKINFARWG